MVWAARRPLCDAIANGVFQISDVREAGKIVIYIAAPRHSLKYKRIQWVEKKKNWKKRKTTSKKCQGRFLHAGAFSLGRTVISCLCTAHTFYSSAPFANASFCRTLAAVIHCITVYKQPPPSLHRQIVVLVLV